MPENTNNDNNIVKMKKHGFNIGTVLFVIVLLYVAFISIHYLGKEHISIYEVTEKQIFDDNETTGIAIRQEEIYKTNTAGYVAFYNLNKTKVGKGSIIYSIDNNGGSNDKVNSNITDTKTTPEKISNIRKEIANFRTDFEYSDYSSVYTFKYNIESSLFSIISDGITKKSLSANGLSVQTSENSGIVAYWSDDLENISVDNISEDMFDENNHPKTMLRTTDKVESGDTVCKVITSENWGIIVKIDEKQKLKLEDKSTVRVRFAKDDFETTVNVELINFNDTYYAYLTLNKYLSRYLDDRYIDLELILSSAEGLKIPTSSILEKNCYIVPVEYLSKGADDDKECITYYIVDSNGNEKPQTLNNFAYKDEEYVYIDASLLNPGTNIENTTTHEKTKLEEIRSIKGVYNVNEGYCRFKHTEIIYENQEYCIVKKENDYGLAVYDHIVINPEKINENDIIY